MMIFTSKLKKQLVFIFFAFCWKGAHSSPTNLWFPKTYDGSVGWDQGCLGYQTILDQKNCSSCCAAAIATTLSVRDCMRDGRNVLYSMMQIWDCTSSLAGSNCDSGTELKKMVNSLGSTEKYLVNDSCSSYDLPYDPNYSRCQMVRSRELVVSSNQTSCGFSSILQSSVYSNELEKRTERFEVDWNGIVAANSLMAEILVNGPVVAILDISNHDWGLFQNYTGGVFVPTYNTSTASSESTRHCLMVYGWGKDNQSGREYWMVQNSWGQRWGYRGRGRIVKNFNWLENEWRGISTKQSPCFPASPSTVNTSCMSRANFDFFQRLNQGQIAYNTDSSYYKALVQAMNEFLIFEVFRYQDREMVYESPRGLSYLSNGEVAAITFFCSIVVIFLIYTIAWKFDLFTFSKNVSSADNMLTFLDKEAKRSSEKFAKDLFQIKNTPTSSLNYL